VIDLGVGHIPEDRQRRGLVLDFSLAENLALHDYRQAPNSRFGWLFPERIVRRARGLLRQFDVRGGGPQTRASALSGGNQQKVVLAREIGATHASCSPLSRREVWTSARSNSFTVGRGSARPRQGPCFSSHSSWRRPSLSDRILVIYEGRIAGEFGPDASEEELGIAMTGGRVGEVAA